MMEYLVILTVAFFVITIAYTAINSGQIEKN